MATSLSDAGLTFANGTIQSSAAQDMIMPIAASVSANALTVSLPPEALVFRSTTLTSGASTAVQTNATISLTVPSGATLGTINGIASRLVVLAIYTGTAVELAIVNLAGGNQLDETNLISTTAIDANSDSANVIYSTTARTNVPYRVMGFVDSTQATAGTWATAPSLVQGVGGTTQNGLLYPARAWVNFNGTGTVAIRAAYNVSSITDVALGRYDVNFATPMADGNYCVQTTGSLIDSETGVSDDGAVAPTANSVRVYSFLSDTNVYTDPVYMNVVIFR